ncbi:MAG: glycosyltransferase family 2 protein [Bacilli bacterium]|nr:glycosyltransferase family 2 protein [Bacilli bacterium]
MFQLLYYLIFIPTLLYGLYFGLTGLFIFREAKVKIGKHKPKNKIAILVASRNEETVIGKLVDSLLKQNYPRSLYEVYVIPNNCTDNTDQAARDAGASIIECKHKVSSKGEVLKHVFDVLLKKDYDAFIVFDADNIVHPNFLSRMNDALCEGYEVAQGFRDSKNPNDNWISGGYSLFYWGQNIFFSKARMSMNGSASINGTGFMVKRTVLEQYGFNPSTMTEDIEFTAQCALNGKQIVFVEDAITYDEQPFNFKVSWKQRKRWSIGTYQCLVKYSWKLFKASIKKRSLACFDMSLFFLAPVCQVIGMVLLGILLVYNWIGIRLNDLFAFMFAYRYVFFVLSYFLSVGIAIFVVKYNKKEVKNSLTGIMTFPFFLITWIPINIVCLYTKKVKWDPIKHTRDISIDNITTGKI